MKPERGGSRRQAKDREWPTLDLRTRAQWRAWLRANHALRAEVWLVFHKRHTGVRCIAYGDAVEEALCFGWVDSLIRRLDDDRYARKFTPRTADSRWSAANRERYASLAARGQLAAAGRARAPGRRRAVPPLPPAGTPLPAYIERALQADSRASGAFARLPPSQRRLYVGWIDSAKRPETREKRLREAVARLRRGLVLGLK